MDSNIEAFVGQSSYSLQLHRVIQHSTDHLFGVEVDLLIGLPLEHYLVLPYQPIDLDILQMLVIAIYESPQLLHRFELENAQGLAQGNLSVGSF